MTPPLLKVDFHVHTGEDPRDSYIEYSARQLLEKAAEYHFDAITIANHTEVLYNEGLRRYAERLGILLIPGVEAVVEGKHVLIVNCRQNQQYRHSLSFRTLRAYAGEEAFIIAPHPFYPKNYCLQEKLEEHIEIFDAIEYAHFYFRLINFNRKAVALAQKYSLPLVGTSDAHHLEQLHQTYTLVDAEKTIPAIIDAVKNHRVRVVSRPLSSLKLFKEGIRFFRSLSRKLLFYRYQDDDIS